MTDFPFHKVLVANRGEIARRLIRTIRALGLASVAVYSDADADYPHVTEADEAVWIGTAEPRGSYLDIDAILGAARSTGADAVHPGYGFLSENAAFALACEEAGLVFVGPPGEVLAESADKLTVKRRVAEAGVPVVPGPLDIVAEQEEALVLAGREAGYPLLLKAAAGGGGKGMRRVEKEEDIAAAAASARREAGGAFGDTALYVERVVLPARHVEVQILADDGGRVVALGERDCSVQRRHQKVLEETPAPGLDEDLRLLLHAAAVTATEAIGYRNAGTVEFLLAPDGQFYFLEFNRRLQVEHPVTEAVLGLDLVAWQLRLAAGQPLPTNGAFSPRGHAIEARVYAEDPAQQFMPSSGRVLGLRLPGGPGVRVDSALVRGLEVSTYYDPLLAKVIAHGETREDAIRSLDLALADTAVLGVRTNVGFLRRILAHEPFLSGNVRTDMLDRASDALCPEPEPPTAVFLAAAAHALLPGAGTEGGALRRAIGDGEPISPWQTLAGFRLSKGRS